MLVGVLDHEANGRTRGLATKNAAEQLDLVLLVAWRRDARLPGASTVQLGLDVIFVDVDARGHAINDTTNSRSMRLAESRKTEYIAK